MWNIAQWCMKKSLNHTWIERFNARVILFKPLLNNAFQ